MGTREQFARLLKETRISQAEVARKIERGSDWVSRRLPGSNRPLNIYADDIPMLARALGVPCSEFFRDSECPETAEPPQLPVQSWMVDAVQQQVTRDLVELPEPEREVARRMGSLLLEYRDRILREERGEG